MGLLLHGYTEVLELVNERLPPPEPEENPDTWRLPLTSIHPYLLANVDPHRDGLANSWPTVFSESLRLRDAQRSETGIC